MSDNAHSAAAPKVSILDRPLRILHLEDNRDDRALIQGWLRDQNIAAEFTNAENGHDFLRLIELKPFDIVLSDKALPGFDGLAALRHVREKYPHIPFVFVSGSMGEEVAIETIKDGATDYVLKDRLSRLIPAVQRAIRESEQEERRRQIEEKNRQQAALLDQAQDAILVTGVDDVVLYCNKSTERIYGWPAAEMMGRKAGELLQADPAQDEEIRQALLLNGNWSGELTRANRGGNQIIVESHRTLMRDEHGQPKSVFTIDTDITEKKAIETKFLRSQRMDSIGSLAGGIAHDLNNALAPVLMGAELLGNCDDAEERRRYLEVIATNVRRATDLVNQILNFARGTGHRKEQVGIRPLISEMGRMIQDTFPKSIVLALDLPKYDLWMVRGDPTEIHQVLLNLCVNARDAMPQGGRLVVAADNFQLDETTATANGTKAGSYVRIRVIDTGTGIPPEALPRIFEPFFTTKPGDRGTGLGLSTVVTIVKQHGGFLDLHTESGRGTEFQVCFPSAETFETTEFRAKEKPLPTGNGELVLLIDDEETVLELTRACLESYGYQVITAQNGLEGIARFREAPEKIKLVITDTDMPHLDGIGAIRAITLLKADIPVILVSGARSDLRPVADCGWINLQLLEKPLALDQLLLTVHRGLHR